MYSIIGLTPLHLAVQDGNKNLAKMLLDCGADINAVVSKIFILPHHQPPQILTFLSSCTCYVHSLRLFTLRNASMVPEVLS